MKKLATDGGRERGRKKTRNELENQTCANLKFSWIKRPGNRAEVAGADTYGDVGFNALGGRDATTGTSLYSGAL